MDTNAPDTPRPEPPPDSAPLPQTVPSETLNVIRPPAENIWLDEPRPIAHRRTREQLALILFLMTCLSTFAVGFVGDALPVLLGANLAVLRDMFTTHLARNLSHGLTYAGCVMAILSAHELGHYLQARRNHVPASLPFFIPFPISPFGTMGAVIVQQSGVADRKSMFDIAITGPLAGLVLAVPLAYFGICDAKVETFDELPGQMVRIYSDPLLLQWMIRYVHGPLPPGADVTVNPMLFAGWVGVFITALNLLPIGQLDGGHVLYCLIGRRAHYVARGVFLAAAATVAYNVLFGDKRFLLWTLMLVLIWLIGTRHPATSNDRVPLGGFRVVLGWLTLMFIFIGLTPIPIYDQPTGKIPRPPVERHPEQEIQVRVDLPAKHPAGAQLDEDVSCEADASKVQRTTIASSGWEQ
jgi:Zn-dependent protease